MNQDSVQPTTKKVRRRDRVSKPITPSERKSSKLNINVESKSRGISSRPIILNEEEKINSDINPIKKLRLIKP